MADHDSPTSEQVAMAWAAVKTQLDRGTRELVLSFDAERSLGDVAMKEVLSMFEASVGAKGSILRDDEHSVIRILPPPVSAVSRPPLIPSRVARNGRAKVAKDRMSKVPRPPNAFILYRQYYHPKLKAQHRDMHNNEISIKLGQQWQEEESATKQHYKDKADEMKKKHNEQHPTYQYQPRRASEKKRRMTKAKAARSSSSASPSSSPPEMFGDNAPNIQAPSFVGREMGMHVPQSSLTAAIEGPNGTGPLNLGAFSPGFRLLANGNSLTYDHESANQAAMLNMSFTEDAADEAVYDDAMIDWNQWTTNAGHVRQQTKVDFQNFEATIAPQSNAGIPDYDQPMRNWQQHTANAYLRHERLHTEFQGQHRPSQNMMNTSAAHPPEPRTEGALPMQNYQEPSVYVTADPAALAFDGAAAQSSQMPATEALHVHEQQPIDTELPSQFMHGNDIQQYDSFMFADDGLFTNLNNFDPNIDDGVMFHLDSEP